MTAPQILHRVGLAACILLVVSCFIPWTYYDDASIVNVADRTFTGFYTYKNNYGKPGKMMIVVAVLVMACMLISKIWAKRSSLFIAAIGVGYAIKSYILFTSCYNAYCPEKKAGIYLMLLSAIVMMICTAFPPMKLEQVKTKKTDQVL